MELVGLRAPDLAGRAAHGCFGQLSTLPLKRGYIYLQYVHPLPPVEFDPLLPILADDGSTGFTKGDRIALGRQGGH